MITVEDSPTTYEYEKHYVVYPQMIFNDRMKIQPKGIKVKSGFIYSSGTNHEWLSVEQIKERLKQNVIFS